MIEAVMLVLLGFFSASLLALMLVPALARRAERLARRRAEATFPLSLAEIAADRDHLRAQLAVRERSLEQKAERGFAARSASMRELGGRDMTIGRLEQDRRERDAMIARLESELEATNGVLAATRATLERETADHAATAETLLQRIADLAVLERSLAETRKVLTVTDAELSARVAELNALRDTSAQVAASLAQREVAWAVLRREHDALTLVQTQSRTHIMDLERKNALLQERLAEQVLANEAASDVIAATAAARDQASRRADGLGARLAQADAAVAAADARHRDAAEQIARLEAALRGQAGDAAQGDNAALRREIVALAERLLPVAPSRQAAE